MTAVRIAEVADAAGIAAQLKTQTPVADVERQIATASSGGAVQFVAIDEGNVVGMAALLPSRFLPSETAASLLTSS